MRELALPSQTVLFSCKTKLSLPEMSVSWKIRTGRGSRLLRYKQLPPASVNNLATPTLDGAILVVGVPQRWCQVFFCGKGSRQERKHIPVQAFQHRSVRLEQEQFREQGLSFHSISHPQLFSLPTLQA